MRLKLWVATVGALLAVPVSALAQQSHHAPDPAGPGLAVPYARYESAFTSASLPAPAAKPAVQPAAGHSKLH